MEQLGVKNCPYCGESINANAQKCKHCGEFLDSAYINSGKPELSPELNDFRDNYKGNTFLMLVLFLLAGYIYVFFWIGERYRAINNLFIKVDNTRRSNALTPVTVIWAIISVHFMNSLFNLTNLLATSAYIQVIQIVLIFFTVLSLIITTLVLFKMARMLELSIKQSIGSDYKINRFLLFFLSIFYFNYKINKLDQFA